LVYGDYKLIQKEHKQIYAFTRTLDKDEVLILLNFSENEASFALDNLAAYSEIKINNYLELAHTESEITLKPYQAVILGKD